MAPHHSTDAGMAAPRTQHSQHSRSPRLLRRVVTRARAPSRLGRPVRPASGQSHSRARALPRVPGRSVGVGVGVAMQAAQRGRQRQQHTGGASVNAPLRHSSGCQGVR
jgi:hypothetical protein